MTFKVPTDFEGQDSTFEFETPDGKQWSIPKLQYIPFELFDSVGAKGGVQKINLFEALAPGITASIKSMNPLQLKALDEAWQTASVVGLGESKGSTS